MLVAMALVAAAVADPASPAAKSGAEPGFFCEYKKIESFRFRGIQSGRNNKCMKNIMIWTRIYG
jgi:hypothetical protein